MTDPNSAPRDDLDCGDRGSQMDRRSYLKLAGVASMVPPIGVFPVAISYAVFPMWDDVAAIGAAIALSLLTALIIERLDRPRAVGEALAVLVGLNSLIVPNYFGWTIS